MKKVASDQVESGLMTTHVEPQFEQLPMRRREITRAGNNQYRIITADGEHQNIEANTAYEAFKLSGLKEAVKIERLANIKQIIFDRSKFKDEKPAEASDSLTDIMKAEAEEFEQLKRLKNPIISADDLDKIMRSFSTQQVVEDQGEVITPSNDSAGTDVHGDGFDEIIPAAPAAKAMAKSATVAAIMQEGQPQAETASGSQPVETSDSEVPHEKTLSPEEVEKLLNG